MNDKYNFRIIWNTRKIKSLFSLKDKNNNPDCVIYKGTCNCGETYIGETDRNVKIRWEEHNKSTHNSEPAKHIKNNTTHKFEWEILTNASKFYKKRKILENYYIVKYNPSLNDQNNFDYLNLFRWGVT